MSVTVIYHAGCWDGFCAAWLFRKAFPDAEFVPAYHGTPPPDVAGRTVYVLVAQHVRHARPRPVGGHLVPVVNATVLFSEIAGELAKGRPFGAVYFDRGDGVRPWSLRSDPAGLDVAAVAQSLGGGGHTHAAGFEEVVA